MKNPKVALVHEFFTQWGGAENVFASIAELFPDAPIYTAKLDKKCLQGSIKDRNIIAPKSAMSNGALMPIFTFLMAPVFEDMDFREYDLIISDGNTWNKGILTKPDQLHITYLHTPPRFLYKYSTESKRRNKWYFKIPFSYVDNILRLWDYVAAQRPEYILVNSKEVQKRVKKFYGRDSMVVSPPTTLNISNDEPENKIDGPYFMCVGRLASYKNFDLVIKALNKTGDKLVIVGTGADEKHLKSIANENIIFVGRVSDKEKHALLSKCQGLINPVRDEDWGIVPLEAHAHGKPVLAHNSGGHRETIIEGQNGMFFDKIDEESFIESFAKFKKNISDGKYNAEEIKKSVQRFSEERFKKEIYDFIQEKWAQFEKEKNA